ncbi:hypothetical protein AGIG_G25479 [Arapaima gigas]
MKWKRVKGGQQGALAREKELVNVKKVATATRAPSTRTYDSEPDRRRGHRPLTQEISDERQRSRNSTSDRLRVRFKNLTNTCGLDDSSSQNLAPTPRRSEYLWTSLRLILDDLVHLGPFGRHFPVCWKNNIVTVTGPAKINNEGEIFFHIVFCRLWSFSGDVMMKSRSETRHRRKVAN